MASLGHHTFERVIACVLCRLCWFSVKWIFSGAGSVVEKLTDFELGLAHWVKTGFEEGIGRSESPRSRLDAWKALGSLPSVALSSFQMDRSYEGQGCWANDLWDLVCGCRFGCGGDSRGLSSGLSCASCGGELLVWHRPIGWYGEDGQVTSSEFIGGCDVSNRGVQPHGVVVLDVRGD